MMAKRWIAGATALVLAMGGAAWGQASPQHAASAASMDAESDATVDAPAAPQPAKVLPPLYVMVGARVRAAEAENNGCDILAHKASIPMRSLAVLVRKVVCIRYSGSTTFYEVLFDGKRYLMSPDDFTTRDERLRETDARTTEQVEANIAAWVENSKGMAMVAKRATLEKLSRSKAQGIAILTARIFDVSEHTEGTGFSVHFYNSGTKTIKYLTAYVVGYNAVKDAVRDRYGRSTTVTLRGVGPIESGESSSYSRDYMWMTDIVQSFDIKSIKLEFMDGTSHVVAQPNKVWLSQQEYDVLMGTN